MRAGKSEIDRWSARPTELVNTDVTGDLKIARRRINRRAHAAERNSAERAVIAEGEKLTSGGIVRDRARAGAEETHRQTLQTERGRVRVELDRSNGHAVGRVVVEIGGAIASLKMDVCARLRNVVCLPVSRIAPVTCRGRRADPYALRQGKTSGRQ